MSKMNAYNTAVLIGRLATDPEIKYVGSTKKMQFVIAVRKSFVRKDEVDAYFIPISVWGNRVNGLEKLIASGVLRKGTMVSVVGELRVESYEDRSGIRRKSIEVAANDVSVVVVPKGLHTAESSIGSVNEAKEVAEAEKNIDVLDALEEDIDLPDIDIDDLEEDFDDIIDPNNMP